MWKRSGECNRCGSCCVGNAVEGVEPVVEGYCAYFRWIEVGVIGECVGRETEFYLRGCNVWPTHPHCISVHPKCSYSFEWE